MLNDPAMKISRRASSTRLSNRIVTTLGDLIAAAYEVSEGVGRQRAMRAAVLLTGSPLARRYSRPLRFVR